MDKLKVVIRAPCLRADTHRQEGATHIPCSTVMLTTLPGSLSLVWSASEHEIKQIKQEIAQRHHRPIFLPDNAFEIEFIYRQRYFWRRAAAFTFIIALVGVLTGAG